MAMRLAEKDILFNIYKFTKKAIEMLAIKPTEARKALKNLPSEFDLQRIYLDG